MRTTCPSRMLVKFSHMPVSSNRDPLRDMVAEGGPATRSTMMSPDQTIEACSRRPPALRLKAGSCYPGVEHGQEAGGGAGMGLAGRFLGGASSPAALRRAAVGDSGRAAFGGGAPPFHAPA